MVMILWSGHKQIKINSFSKQSILIYWQNMNIFYFLCQGGMWISCIYIYLPACKYASVSFAHISSRLAKFLGLILAGFSKSRLTKWEAERCARLLSAVLIFPLFTLFFLRRWFVFLKVHLPSR